MKLENDIISRKRGVFWAGLFLILLPSLSHSHELVFAIKSSELGPYNAALKGVKEVFQSARFKGNIREYDLSNDSVQWGKVLTKIREERPNILITFGTFAAQLAKRDIKDIPIIFSTVLNPEDSGLVSSLTAPGGNITGASLDIPIDNQFSYILKVVPSAKKIGVLFNPKETGLTIERAREAAAGMGLTLVAEPLNDERELPDDLDRLLKKIDVLWGVADSTVFSMPAVQQIIIETIRNKVPFMGISPSFVKAGALFSLKWDDVDIGRQAGESALKVLTGPSEPQDIPVTTPRNISIAINLKTAKAIGLVIQRNILEASEVYR